MNERRSGVDRRAVEEPQGLSERYQAALVEMVSDLDAVTDLVRRSLRREDVERVVLKLGGEGHDPFTARVAELFRRVSALLLASRRLSDSLSLDVLLERTVELICEFVGAERCTIFLHDRSSDELYTRVAMGLKREVRLAADRGLAGAAFRSGQPILVADAYADARFNPEVDKGEGYRTRSVLCVPLRHQRDGESRIVGVVQVLNKRDGGFGEDDVRLVDMLNSQASAALVNAVLHEEVQRTRTLVDHGVRSVASLLEVSKALAAEVDLDSLLEVILAQATDVMQAERASFFVYEEDTRTLCSRVSRTLGRGQVRVPLGVGIAGHVAETLSPLNIPDAYADARFNPEVDRATSFRTRSILCAPVATRAGRLVGVIQVLNKRDGGPFTEEDVAFLEAFASHAAIAVDRARLVEAFVEKQKIEETLRLGHDIQMGMLPRPVAGTAEFELVARLRPARSVGGDLYDFLRDGDRLWFLIADVSGKGVGAALFMAVARTLFRAAAPGQTSPAAVLTRMNREIARDNERMLFVTAFLGCLELPHGELLFGNAGHNPPYRLSPDGSVSSVHGAHGVPLGVLPDYEYSEQALSLARAEGLFLYTDGVTEAMSPAGEQFSTARLEAYLRGVAAPAEAERLVAGCFGAVEAFEAGARQTDDIAVMLVRYLGG